MSPLLRSSKFIRCFSTVCRNVSVRSGKLSALVEKSVACSAVKRVQTNSTRPFAVEAFKERQSVERCLHNLDFEARQKGRISGKDIEDVIYAVKTTGEISSSQALLLIRCCGNLVIEETPQKRTELAANVMSTLKELGVPLDISHYNALLKVYLENKTEFSPFEYLQELEKSNIVPNRVTYQYLIGSFCLNGDIVGATKILELMKENKIPINEIIFNYLIIGHSEANDIESAADIINIMKEKGIEPSAASYAALLNGYAKFGNIQKIREILNLCDKEELGLLDKDYMNIIFTLTTNGHVEYIDEIIGKMKKSIGYNQDIINLSFRLINEGKDDVAVKVIKSMVSQDRTMQTKSGIFIVHFLLRHNQPIQRVVKIAKMLKDEGVNDNALTVALREMLIYEKRDDAIFLLRNMKENGLDLRPHYFYPLLCQAGKNRNNRLIVDTLKLMRALSVPRTVLTLKNFALPNYEVRNLERDFGILFSAGLSSNFLAEALFTELAKKGDLKSCEELATNFYLSWDKRCIQRLVESFSKKGDVESFLNIIVHLFDCFVMEHKIINEEDLPNDEIVSDVNSGEKEEIIDGSKAIDENNSRDKEFGEYIISRVAKHFPARPYLQAVVEGFINNGIGIRQSSIESLLKLGGDAVPLDLIEKLASPDLKPKPVEKSTSFIEKFPAIRVIKPSQSRDEISEEDKHFLYLVNSKLAEQAVSEFEKFRANNSLSKFHYKNMIKLHVLIQNFDEAVKLGSEMLTKYPDENINDYLTLYYVEALINSGRYEEGVALFKSLDFSEAVPEQLILNIVSRYVSYHSDELIKAQELLEVGLEKNIVHPRHFSVILNEYLKKQDYESAANLFCEIVQKHKFPVLKNQVLRQMIESGNPDLLERVTNSLAEINGQINSLLDLVVAFAEVNKVKQTRKLLETQGLIFGEEKMKYICERFLNFGNETAIECLINASKGMTKLNRSLLYDYYLECTLRSDDVTKALNLWTRMQEEDVTPSEDFLLKLSVYLRRKGLPVPFKVKNVEHFELNQEGKLMTIDSIGTAIIEKDFDKFCTALEYFLRAKRRIPFLAVQNYIRDEIVLKGDIPKLNKIRTIFPAMKSHVTWEAMLFIAYGVDGRRKEYLEGKLNDMLRRRERNPINRIPFRTLLSHCLQDPTLVKEIEEVEEKAKEKQYSAYTGVLWAYHIVNKNFEAARNYTCEDYSVVINHVKNFGFVNQNTDVFETLLTLKDAYNIKNEQIGSIYNDLLHVLKSKDKIVEMQIWLDKAIQDNMDRYISQDKITYINVRTKPSLSQIQDSNLRNPITVFVRNFHNTRRQKEFNEVEPESSNRESSFFPFFKSHILQDCSPQIKFLKKDQISLLKNTCYWIMKVNHTDEPKTEKEPKIVEGKKAENEDDDLVSHLIGFQSSSISTRGEKDWMKFLKDDSGLLFNKDSKKPTMPNPKYQPEYKPTLINMPPKPDDVIIMDSIDDGSNEEMKLERDAATSTTDISESFEEDLERSRKSQSKDI